MLHRCPLCNSRHVKLLQRGPMLLSKIATTYATCGLCRTVWEAKPWQPTLQNGKDDLSRSTPCDNCAYGCAEIDRLAEPLLRRLIWSIQRTDNWLACHKGLPIRETAEGGRYTFDILAVHPRRRRACAGAVRIGEQIVAKGDDWIREKMLVLGPLPEPAAEGNNDGQ